MQISNGNSIKPIVRERHFPKWGTPAFGGKNGKIWKSETGTQGASFYTLLPILGILGFVGTRFLAST